MSGIRSLASALSAIVLTASPVAAQDGGTQQPTAIESITVTAEKTEEDLQDTALSIQAFGSEDLEARGIQETDDIANYTPGLNFKSANNSTNQLALVGRGFASADNDSLVPTPVGLYVDGVYHGSGIAASFELMDIERVEVLKGPQGTGFGRNTVGGAVSVISVKPGPEFGGSIRLGAGDHEARSVRASINVPLLSEKLYARGAFLRQSRDPYYKNRIGTDYQDQDLVGGRLALRWLVSESLTVDAVGESISIDSSVPIWLLRTTTGIAGHAPFIGREPEDDISTNGDVFDRTDIWQYSVTATWDLSENLQVKAINGWRRWKFSGANDLDGSPLTVFHSGQHDRHRVFYSELQVAGTGMDGLVDYYAGGTWFEEESDSDKFTLSTLFGGAASDTRNIQQNDYAWGLYGQTEWHLSERIDFTTGLRFSHDRKSAKRSVCLVNPTQSDARFCAGVAAATNDVRSARFDNWSPMARLAYHWSDAIMTYALWSRGYRSGRFGNRPTDGSDLSLDPVDEETVSQWEVGWKTRFFDDRLQINGAAFYGESQDQQLTFFVPTGGGGTATVLANAGESRIRGWELELLTVPIDGLEISATYGWTDSDLKEFIALDLDPTSPTFMTVADVSNQNNLSIEPKRTYSATAKYTFPPTGIGTFVLTGSFYWRGKQAYILNRRQSDLQDENSYGVFGARLSLLEAFGKEGLSLAVSARNLGDRVYRTNGVTFPFGAGIEWSGNTFGDPRQLMAELRYDFGSGN